MDSRALIQGGLGTFTVRQNRSIKVIISGGGGFRGLERIVHMGEAQQQVRITQSRALVLLSGGLGYGQ